MYLPRDSSNSSEFDEERARAITKLQRTPVFANLAQPPHACNTGANTLVPRLQSQCKQGFVVLQLRPLIGKAAAENSLFPSLSPLSVRPSRISFQSVAAAAAALSSGISH